MFGFITKIDLHGTPDHIRIEFAIDRSEGIDAIRGKALGGSWVLRPPETPDVPEDRIKIYALYAAAGAKLAASIDATLTAYREGAVTFSDFLDRIEGAHATYEREVSQ